MADASLIASVVVPFWNSAAHIETCIRALLAQDMPPDQYEIILVDNNSGDGSDGLARRFDRVRIIGGTKAGSYAARNRGLAEARGELLVFTDADCAPDPAWLRHHVAAVTQPGVEAVLGLRRPALQSTPLRLMMLYEETKAAVVFSGSDRSLYYGYTNNMSVRKRTLLEMGGFHEVRRGADSIFVRQIVDRKGCDAVRYCRDAAITHLEISSLHHWYAKHAIYGRSNQRNSRRTVTCRPMSLIKRWSTYRAAVLQHQLGPVDTVLLLGVLTVGGMSYEAGRLWGRVGF